MNENLPDDLADVHRRLRAARPESDPEVLTRATRRARARLGGGPAGPTRRLRVAIVALLVAGFSMSGAGAGLAIDGIGGRDVTASQDQYQTGDSDEAGNEVLGDDASGGDPGSAGDEASDEAGAGSGGDSENGQVAQQIAAGDSTSGALPFTGWAALPVFALGLLLLMAGVVLRRRTHAA